MYSGWLGGTLVYRNQIGVDHRGPNATKWRESGAIEGPPGEPVAVARMAEFEKPGQMKLVHLNGHRIVLARHDDRILAFQDHCTHRGGPLSDGVLACNRVTCPWHGSQFDIETGQVVSGPAEEKIQVYPVRVQGEIVQVIAPEPLPDATVAGRSGFLPPEPTREKLEQAAKQAGEKARAMMPVGDDGGSED
jgi:nitrite reductase/ring-hydroxylating ferredoxin subunit